MCGSNGQARRRGVVMRATSREIADKTIVISSNEGVELFHFRLCKSANFVCDCGLSLKTMIYLR